MVAVIIPLKKIDDTTHFGFVWRLLTPGSHPTSTVPPPTPKHFAFHASIALTADHTGPLQRVLDQAANHGPRTSIYHLSLAFTSRAWFAWRGSKWSRSFQVQSITPKRCTARVPSALLTDSITASTGYGGYNLQIIPFWWKFVVATPRMLHLFDSSNLKLQSSISWMMNMTGFTIQLLGYSTQLPHRLYTSLSVQVDSIFDSVTQTQWNVTDSCLRFNDSSLGGPKSL